MDSNTTAPESNVETTEELKYSRMIADLPFPKGQVYFGNILQLAGRQSHLTLAKWHRELGPFYRINAMGRQVVVIAERNAADSILRDRPAGFRRSQNTRTIMNELNIGGVITAEGDDWRKQRKLVMGGLSVEVIRNFFPTMIFMTERLMRRWKVQLAEGRPVDLQRDLKAMALDIIVGLSMGHDIDAVDDEEKHLQRNFDNMLRRLERRSASLFPYWRYLRMPVDHAVDKSSANVEKAVMQFVINARARMKEKPELYEKPTNMLEAMIAASETPGSNFTDQELISNAVLSVIGGEDTTANTLSWMMNLLAENPAAAAKLTAEVDAVLGDEPLMRDWELMKQLPYLDAVHNEAQRLRSVAPLIGVISNADCTVADLFIPKDTPIIVSTSAEGLDEAQFPDNDLFQPERWIFEQKPPKEDDPNRKLFPFGGGARMCPGRFLALTEIKMVVSMVMRNFELEVDTKAPPVEQVMNFFVGPSAVPVRLKLRA